MTHQVFHCLLLSLFRYLKKKSSLVSSSVKYICRTHPAEAVKHIKLNTNASNQTPSFICFDCVIQMNEIDRKSLIEIP